jgi:type IV pilus assembly protein PilM
MVSLFQKAALGIDVGMASIKMVELSSFGSKKKLENYVEFQLPQSDSSLKAFHSEEGLLLADQVAGILKGILRKVNIKQQKVAFAIPDFCTFFTTFTLPPMSEAEIPNAIEFEARHHIPIPLSEVSFDWQIIEKEEKLPAVRLKVLLVAVPKKVLLGYQRVAEICGFEIKGLEAEVFGLIRSVAASDKLSHPVCLIDFGWRSTTISIVENRSLLTSHSFDISGSALARELSTVLKVSFNEAEAIKKGYGLDPRQPNVFQVLSAKIDAVSSEIEKVCNDFSQGQQTKHIEDIIISGGMASLFGLKDYLSSRLKKNVSLANPFHSLASPQSLGERLKQLGPSFAVAIGVGMMGVEA